MRGLAMIGLPWPDIRSELRRPPGYSLKSNKVKTKATFNMLLPWCPALAWVQPGPRYYSNLGITVGTHFLNDARWLRGTMCCHLGSR